MRPYLRACIAIFLCITGVLQAQQVRTPSALPVPQGTKAWRDLAYVKNGHERQKLDLFVPEKSDGPLPLLIWIHGGGWQNGSKEGCPPLRNGYTGRGYAVASLNYRLSGHATFPAQIEDCKAAIRWLRAHAAEYNLDPQRFGAWGSSAGGHLVALTGTSGDVKEFDIGAHLDQSSRVQAVCDYYGPTDFTVFVTTPGYESHDTDSSPEAKLLGGAVMHNKDKAARLNPITYVTADDPAFLIVHGDEDKTVPLNQSELLFDALKKAGTSVHFHIIKGAGHGSGFGGPEIEPMVSAFFESQLKSKSPPPAKEAKTSESAASGGPPGAGKSEPKKAPRSQGMSFDGILERTDKDKDGRVSREEFRGPPALFQRLDGDSDGYVSREEHEASPGQATSPQPAAPAPTPTPVPTTSASTREAPMTAPGDISKNFKLEGDRWTYRDGEFEMNGILLKPEGQGPFPAVLISHGLGGAAEGFGMQKASEMRKWGFVCIAPNYTHNGRTTGEAGKGARRAPQPDYGSSPENLRRARTCMDILRSLKEVDSRRLYAYGHSMGGFVTIGLAAAEPGLLKAAAITGSGLAPRDGYPAPSATTAEKIRTPFLMLHGSEDSTVRPEQSAALKQVLDKNKIPNDRLVADGQGHPIDQTMRDEVFKLVREWFQKPVTE